LEALTRYYADIRGKISIAKQEILEPHVQVAGNVAILTFRFVSYGKGESAAAMRWNCTEVYRRDAEGFRIIQTHWSFTQSAHAA
jgi:ketosteroid isomerase-like protein